MNAFGPGALMIAASALLLAVILALVGAELPSDTLFWQALPLWLVIVAAAVILLVRIDAVVSGLLRTSQLPAAAVTALTGAATVLITALPLALMCLPLDGLLPDQDALIAADGGTTPVAGLLRAWADQYLNLLPATAGVWLFIMAIGQLIPASEAACPRADAPPAVRADADELAEAPDAGRASGLARRHPDIAGEGLLAIEADEHYVRFHTAVASRHRLCRFRDALKDVEGLAGLQVHRSWWVAADAIEGAERSGSALGLKLANGLLVPVSQTYRREVEKLMDDRAPKRRPIPSSPPP